MPKTENLAKKENKIKIGVKTPEHTPTLPFNLETKQTRIVCHSTQTRFTLSLNLELLFRMFLIKKQKKMIYKLFYYVIGFACFHLDGFSSG